MLDSPVNDVSAWDAALDRLAAGFEFGNHPRLNTMGSEHLARLAHGQLGDERTVIVRVLQNPTDVREDNQFLALECRCHGTGDVVRVDVIALTVRPDADG